MYLAYRSFLNVTVAGVRISENLNFRGVVCRMA
jgi:hypothetical protein